MRDKAVVAEVIRKQPESSTPTLLKFQNGSLAAINKENTSYCRMLKDGNRPAAMVVASGQIYHGQLNTTGNQAGEEPADLYICVRNKSTNKVRIMPIEQVHLNNHIYNDKSEVRLPSISKETAKVKMLKEFGGRNASRFLAKQKDLKMDIALYQDEVDATVQEISLGDFSAETLDTQSHLDIIRPPFNRDATHVRDVYDINTVVPGELLARLEEESKAVYSTSLENIPVKSEFLRSCIEKIQNATSSVENFLKIKLIIYMDCLLNMITTRVRKMRDYELSSITDKVENDVRRRFCDPNSKNFLRTALSSEKALCYFIVLSMLISDNFEADLKVLAQELRCPRNKVVKYAHIVHARPKAKTDILMLRLPSDMPPLPQLGKRKTM